MADSDGLLNNIFLKNNIYILEETSVIGRCAEAFVYVNDVEISRKHCVIDKCEDGSYTIQDKSVNGTYLNKEKMLKDKVYKLQDQDQINLANCEQYTYTFTYKRPKTSTEKEKREELSLRIKEKIVNLDNTYTDNMKNLDSKLTQLETEESDLKENMNRRIEELDNEFKNEQFPLLPSLLNGTKEQKEEAELKLREIKANARLEKSKLMEEVERKIADIPKKEKELQQAKIEMELRYQNKRRELEDRCREIEICDLKEKLAEFELELKRRELETREAEQKLEETKKEVDEKTKESSSKDEVVKHLEKQLREQEKAAEKFKKEMEAVEEELRCSICASLFIEPYALNCGHMFCKTCIIQWNRQTCPYCRADTETCVSIFAVNTIVAKIQQQKTGRKRKQEENED